MKTLSRLATVVALAFVAVLPLRADQIIKASGLPEAAQSFIASNYAGIGVRECERDDDGHYDVELKNGVDMEFGETGKLIKIDAGRHRVSKSILKSVLPAKVYSELETRNLLSKVEEVELNRYNIKIDIRQMWNDELIFDLDGNLLLITD